jgi:hypothetical protein
MAAILLLLTDLPGLVEVQGVLLTDESQYVLVTPDGKELLAIREAWRVARRCPPLQGHAGCHVRVVGVLGTFRSNSGNDVSRQVILIWHIGPVDGRRQVEGQWTMD